MNYMDYLDRGVLDQYNHFLKKVNERTEWQFGLRDSYSSGGNPALGQDVEYFGWNICQDDRMRYIMENIVTLPDSELSQYNKIGNTIISHFYGARGIHTLVTGVNDPKKAHFDFVRCAAGDEDYIRRTELTTQFYRRNKKSFYGTTELHTSIQTAARNFCREKYNDPARPAGLTDILEWISSWVSDGTMDRIINDTNSLEDMFNLLKEKPGIGDYYGYHCATSNSVNPALKFNHDERFSAPGPGAVETLNSMFPNLKKNRKTYGDLVVWIRENQEELVPDLEVHPFFHNYVTESGLKVFNDDQSRLKTYGTEVSLCQFRVFTYLSENPELISRRNVVREENDICEAAVEDFINFGHKAPQKKTIITPPDTIKLF